MKTDTQKMVITALLIIAFGGLFACQTRNGQEHAVTDGHIINKDSSIENTDIKDILSQIPYYGDINKCRMSAKQALTYADLIQTADLKSVYGCGAVDEYKGDGFYPVLLDVSNDGIPLLLLVVGNPPNESGILGSCSRYFLYGYKNGTIQEIKIRGNLGLSSINEERLLVFEYEDTVEWASYGIEYHRIQNGTPELILEANAYYWIQSWGQYNIERNGKEYVMNRDYYFINNEEVGEEEFEMKISNNKEKIERLLWEDGADLSVTEPFRKYLPKTNTRTQAAQVFQAYANSLPVLDNMRQSTESQKR